MAEQETLDVGGPTLDGSAARAAARLRADLGAWLAELGAEVTRVGLHGHGVPEPTRGTVADRHEGDKGWPEFVLGEGGGRAGWVLLRAVAATEVNARRLPRLWTQEGAAWERLEDLDREVPGRVVLAFDDGRAIALRDMRRGVHWERSDHGATAHVAIMDRDRRPLAEVLA